MIKKSIMAAQKCKNIWLQAVLKSLLSKLLLLQDHTEQSARIRGSGELLFSSSELKYFSIVSFPIKA